MTREQAVLWIVARLVQMECFYYDDLLSFVVRAVAEHAARRAGFVAEDTAP